MSVEFSKPFRKAYKKAPLKIQAAFDNRLEIFLDNQYHAVLNNHSLQGSYYERRSFNVTGDWRAIFKETDDGIVLLDLGTHSQLYKK